MSPAVCRLAAATLVAAVPVGAAPAAAVETCVDVVNATSYWMPGEAKAPPLASVAFHVQAGQTLRICLGGQLPVDQTVGVTIRSGWAWPVGTCRLRPDAAMRIERYTNDEGEERTRLVCG